MSHHHEPRLRRVAILAYDGVDELDLAGVYVPLAKAAQARSPRFCIRPVLAGVTRRVRGSSGLMLAGIRPLGALERAHAVVIPGGPGVRAIAGHAHVAAMLRRLADRDVPLYAVCSGVFLLAALGLTRGRAVAVHNGKRAELLALGVGRIGVGYVHDGSIRSIGGVPDSPYVKSVELSFQILRELCPEAIAYVAGRLETWPQTTATPYARG
jgi:AraC family transcriptional activator FtrA